MIQMFLRILLKREGVLLVSKILTDKSSKIIHHSNVRSANIPLEKNIYLEPLTFPSVVKSKEEISYDENLV